MKKYLLYILFIALIPFYGFSQCEELDSLWIDLYDYHQVNSNDSIFYAKNIYFKEILYGEIHKTGLDSCKIVYLGYYFKHLSNKSPLTAIDSLENLLRKVPKDNLLNIQIINHTIGYIYSTISMFEEAIKHYQNSLEIFKKNKNQVGLAWASIDIGNVYFVQKKYNMAKSYYFISNNIFSQLTKHTSKYLGMSVCYNNLGLISIEENKIDSSIIYFRKALKLRKESNQKSLILHSYSYLIDAFLLNNQKDSAYHYCEKSVSATKSSTSIPELASVYNKVGVFFYKTLDYDSAYFYLLGAYKYSLQTNIKKNIAKHANDVANLFYKTNKIDSSLNYFLISYKNADSVQLIDIEEQICIKLIEIYTIKNDYENSSVFLKKLLEIRELNNSENITNMQANIEFKERIRVEKEFIVKQKKYNTTIVSMILVLIIFSIIFFIMFYTFKRIKNQKKKLDEKNIELKKLSNFKETITNTIVHDLKNPLSLILNFSENQKNEDSQKIYNYANQMHNMVLSILDTSKRSGINMQINKDNYLIKEIIETAIIEIQFFADKKNITIQYNCKKNIQINLDRKIILRVLNNILFNAIKYTPNNGIIDINIDLLKDNITKISIKDSWEGINENIIDNIFNEYVQDSINKKYASFGLGLAFCKIATEAHSGKIGVFNNLERGSTFWFTIKSNIKTISKIKEHKSVFSHKNILILDAKEKAYIKPFTEKIKLIKIHEISSFIEIYQLIENKNSNIETWKKELYDAFIYYNKSKVEKLLNI